MQVTLELSPHVAPSKISALRAMISVAGLSKQAGLAAEPLKSNRRATFVVIVGPPGAGGFKAQVSVLALDAVGELVARGDGAFSGTGNACNAVSMLLSPASGPPPDGGPPLDGGPPVDVGALTYAWKTGTWSSCSQVCFGTQTRSVWCERGDGAKVSDTLCSGTKPATSQSCNTGCTHAWKTGSWSACSKKCDGGTQTRSVWCERSDGVKVSDTLCGGPKPATSQSCNTQPCCSTSTLAANMRCDGNEQVQWTTWGSNTGSAGDRASCATECTKWAKNNGYSQWCCQLYEDSSSGTNWVCRVYDAYSTASSPGDRYAGLGQCQSP